MRDGTDDVAFLTGSEILDQNLAGKLVPGPAIFYETTAVMVDENSPVQHLAELAGQSICYSLGSNAQRHLEAWFAAHHLDFIRQGFQEDVEMLDAYNVQFCRGMAGETTTLAAVRLDGGIRHLKSRILPEPLAAFPILATTGTQDAQWAAIVAWTIHTLVRAETPQTDWAAGGIDSLPIDRGAGTRPRKRLATAPRRSRRNLWRHLSPQSRCRHAARSAARPERALAGRRADARPLCGLNSPARGRRARRSSQSTGSCDASQPPPSASIRLTVAARRCSRIVSADSSSASAVACAVTTAV